MAFISCKLPATSLRRRVPPDRQVVTGDVGLVPGNLTYKKLIEVFEGKFEGKAVSDSERRLYAIWKDIICLFVSIYTVLI